MSEDSDRVGRAFRDHDAFERGTADRFVSTATPFEATVRARERDDGHVEFRVDVRVPMLGAVADDVAPVVEEGWFETFRRRVEDMGHVTRKRHDFEPTVRDAGDEAVVELSFTDIDERRGADDAAAVIDYVEGTYVQGIIPGYEYREPVTTLIDQARAAGGSETE